MLLRLKHTSVPPPRTNSSMALTRGSAAPGCARPRRLPRRRQPPAAPTEAAPPPRRRRAAARRASARVVSQHQHVDLALQVARLHVIGRHAHVVELELIEDPARPAFVHARVGQEQADARTSRAIGAAPRRARRAAPAPTRAHPAPQASMPGDHIAARIGRGARHPPDGCARAPRAIDRLERIVLGRIHGERRHRLP